MNVGQAYRLRRLEKSLFASADVFISKVYGNFYGPKLWPRIRVALQQPERAVKLTSQLLKNKYGSSSSLNDMDDSLLQSSDALDSSFDQLKREFELSKKRSGVPIESSSELVLHERKSQQYTLMKLEDEVTRSGEFYDEDIFFDYDSYKEQQVRTKVMVENQIEEHRMLSHLDPSLKGEIRDRLTEFLDRIERNECDSRSASNAQTHQFESTYPDLFAISLLNLQQNDTFLDLNSSEANFVSLSQLTDPDIKLNALVSDSSETSVFYRRKRVFETLHIQTKDEYSRNPMIFKLLDDYDYRQGLFRRAFSKIVVSVPCIDDRTLLSDNSSRNPFHSSNAFGIDTLATRQSEMLSLAVEGATSGASIVYLLRSLCPSHGDTIVHKTIQSYNATRTTHTPRCNVKDISCFADLLSEKMNVKMGSHGVYIYPDFKRNFGPAYLSLLQIAEQDELT